MLALDFAGGGTLWDYMRGKKKSSNVNHASPDVAAMKGLNKGETRDSVLSEDKCKQIIKGILFGLRHLHDYNYIHRDIKPSNIVFNNVYDMTQCRIIDFGLAAKLNSDHPGRNENGGTLLYQAPEQIFSIGKKNRASDVFTVGFIMFELLTGRHPVLVHGENKTDYKKRMKGYTKIDIKRTFNIPEQAINLIERLTEAKPSARLTVEQALGHPWLVIKNQGYSPMAQRTNTSAKLTIMNNRKNTQASPIFKRS